MVVWKCVLLHWEASWSRRRDAKEGVGGGSSCSVLCSLTNDHSLLSLDLNGFYLPNHHLLSPALAPHHRCSSTCRLVLLLLLLLVLVDDRFLRTCSCRQFLPNVGIDGIVRIQTSSPAT